MSRSGSVVVFALAMLVAIGSPAQAAAQELDPALSAQLQALLTALNQAPVAQRGQVLRQRREAAILYVGWKLAQSLAISPDDLRMLDANRTDKQTGADAGEGASTSLVSKGGVPAVIGFAVENGGLTQSVSGTTITVRGNPYGLVQMVRSELEDAFGTSPIDSPASYLRRFSLAASFDASRGVEEGADPVFRGNEQQLSGFSVRFEPLNRRAPWTEAYRERFTAKFKERLMDPLDDLETARNSLEAAGWFTDDQINEWADEAAIGFESGDIDESTLLAAIDDLADKVRTGKTAAEIDELRTGLGTLIDAYTSLLSDRDDILEVLNKGSILTIEYGNERPLDLPSVHGVRLIAETGLFGGSADLTFNAGIRFWDSTEVFRQAGREIDTLRDWSLALQMDAPVGAIAQGRPLIVSFAGRIEQMRSMLMAEEMMDEMVEDGDMMMAEETTMAMLVVPTDDTKWIAQLKLTIPVKEAGVRVPLSLSFSNRPELLEGETDVRGSIGFTFDLDALIGSTAGR